MNREIHPSQQELQQIVAGIKELWSEAVKKPEANLEDLSKETRILFAAGGGLPLLFGEENNEIWKAMVEKGKADGGKLNIAGVEFGLDELSKMGEFYRRLHNQGFVLHCIDERLSDDIAHREKEVHEHCGACAALQGTLDFGASIEDLLQQILKQGELGKQPLREGMEAEHDSLVILVDYIGSHVVARDKRAMFQERHALPFNVSMPLSLIEEWAAERSADAGQLLDTLARWNVQIARNIISGHNALNQAEEQMVVVKYVGEARESTLFAAADQTVDSVPAGSPQGENMAIG